MKKFVGITIKNEYRKILMDYLKAKEAKKEAENAEKALKTKALQVFEELGKDMKTTEKTEYTFGAIQMQGEEKYVLHKETTKRGSIDWEAYAKSLGGTIEGAEEYRKANIVTVAIDWATDKQVVEIRELLQ